MGPTGPTGSPGIADTITFRNVITSNPGTKAEVNDITGSPNHIFDFVIPRGEQGPQGPIGPQGKDGIQGEIGPTGPTGPTGPSLSRSAYLVTFNAGQQTEGTPINVGENIPIDREEIDLTNLITLNTTDKTLKFNVAGYYRVTFIVSAYIKTSGIYLDKTKDFVTIGFRLSKTDNIYIGASTFIPADAARQLIGQGIISVVNPNNVYELVNLSNQTIYLDTPDLKDISSISYFTNSLVTVNIEYLGRQ